MPSSTERYLGISIDGDASMRSYIMKTFYDCFVVLRQLWSILRSVPRSMAFSLIYSLLDYGNP